jgi:uncharacterized phage-associated protein
MISPIYAANNMIRKASRHGISLTNLKLQKLLYILYAKYYFDVGGSLFSDRFEAWQYGPVLTDIYEIFKREEARQIVDMRPDANGKILVVSETGSFGICFEYVWDNFANKGASYLVGLTHGDENPGYVTAWRKAVDTKGLGAFMEDEDIKKDGEMWFGSKHN